MPYEFDYKHHTLPKELDRRIKLSDTDKEEINILIKQGLWNSEIAVKYWVHRKSIYLIRNPIQAQKEKERYKLRRLDGRYYNKEKQSMAIRDTRRYKQKNKDKLIIPKEKINDNNN